MLTVMIFVLLAAIGFWWFRSKDKKVSNKIFYSFLALGVFLAILSIGTDDTEAALNFDKEVVKNVQLSDEVSELKNNYVELQEKLDALTEEFATVNKEHNKQLEEYDSIKAEKIDTLKSDNSTLQKKLDKKESTSVASAVEQSSKSETNKSDTSSKSPSEKTTEKESKESSESTTADASSPSTGDCGIKGSKTGIYHVPGSTYYNQTKNVAQWFCSEQEAEDAGYRAPKR